MKDIYIVVGLKHYTIIFRILNLTLWGRMIVHRQIKKRLTSKSLDKLKMWSMEGVVMSKERLLEIYNNKKPIAKEEVEKIMGESVSTSLSLLDDKNIKYFYELHNSRK